MGEKREVDRVDEPGTNANEVLNGASSGNGHTLLWLENLCIMEWRDMRILVNDQES